jgi:hypothetical protein
VSNSHNFIEYLGRQEHNLLVSVIELSDAFHTFKILDEIIRQAQREVDIPESDEILGTMWMFVHSQYYFAVSALLRGNISEALNGTRRAIDATLSAYKILDDPAESDNYKSRGGTFRNIKRSVKAEREADSDKYPLADLLIEMHEYCSQMASHADYSGIEPRLESRPKEPGKREQLYHYFDHPTDHYAYHGLFMDLLAVFCQMFSVFKDFIADKHTGDRDQWETAFDAICHHIRKDIDARISKGNKQK